MMEEDYFRILGVGLVRSQGMRKGIVVDLNEVAETVKESIREAERCSGVSLDSAYIGVTGSHISCFNTSSTLSLPRGNGHISPRDMRRLMERARQLRVSRDRELLHALPQIYWNGREGDASGPARVHLDVHVVTASANAVKNLTKSVHRAGVVVEDVILEPLASGEAILRPAEKDVGVVVVDIGGGTTDIAVFKNGTVWHTAAIPVAGYQVTRDISIGLGIPYSLAEELKLKYGALDTAAGPTPSEFPLELENGRVIHYRELVDIVTARITEILQLVWVELGGEEVLDVAPAGIVLTGGTSKTPGIAALARDLFRLPCRVGVPRNISGMVENLHDPSFATTVGLLFWASRCSDKELARHRHSGPLTRLWMKVRRRIMGRR